MKLASFAAALACLAHGALAVHKDKIPNFRNNIFRVPPAGQAPPDTPFPRNGTFQQLIDHDNPSLGTFSQFYYWDDTYYKGPGSPVVLFTPGEINVTYYYTYLTTNRTTGVIAKEIGAAVIVLEHRYWGNSSPYPVLSTENLQYLTLKNAIADLNYLALNLKLPFDKSGASNADKAPWVLVGGSYSGALTAWVEATTQPSVMWAYYASSAVVEAIGNYYQYFVPIQEGMPQNCSADVSRVVEYVDQVWESGNLHNQAKLKKMFGLQDLPNYDDFAEVLVNGPYLWQGNQFFENAGFFDFCDAVEGVNKQLNQTGTVNPGASGVGLEKALQGYAQWVKEYLIPEYCESVYPNYYKGVHNVQCFDSYNKNSPIYTDTSLSNAVDRQWNWMLCNEPFGYWQDGAPKKQATIVSRLVTQQYWVRQCKYFFPTENGFTYGIAQGKNEEDVNAFTQGWSNTNSTRLIYGNGSNDPWRQSTVSSTIRPGGPLGSSLQIPVYVVPGGYHTSDLVTENGVVNPGCAQVQAAIVQTISNWVSEYPTK